MFEKEAEERTKQYMNKHTEKYNCECTKLETDNYNVGREYGYEDGFQDGAEFGYNKAKEEKQEQGYSSFDFVMQYENGKFKCKYKSGKEFVSIDGKTWKEIVLPEEIKEND